MDLSKLCEPYRELCGLYRVIYRPDRDLCVLCRKPFGPHRVMDLKGLYGPPYGGCYGPYLL